MIKYKTTAANAEKLIEPVPIDRETECNVWVQRPFGEPAQEAKLCTYHRYHDTWQEAHNYILNRSQRRIDKAQAELDAATKENTEIKGLTDETN